MSFTISDDTARALASYIHTVEFAQSHEPDSPTRSIFECGCMGPLPECRCAKRHRLVREFVEMVNGREVAG